MTDIEKRSEAEMASAEKEALATLAKIKSEKAKRAEKSEKALTANLNKIKKLVLESGITGSVRFDVSEDGKSILHKVLKARSSNGVGRKADTGKGNSRHLTAEVNEYLNKALADKKVRPVACKDRDGYLTVAGKEISATALGQYAILAVGDSSAEVQKFFPELSTGQCNGVTRRWMTAGHAEKVKANLAQSK